MTPYRFLFLCFVLAPLCLQSAPKRESSESFFPIMAWDDAPNDLQVLRKMRECGLTVAGFVSPEALDDCHAAGLKAIVQDSRTADYDWENVDEKAARKNVASLVNAVGKHPALYGFYLRDEPDSSLFSGLAKVASLVQEMAPDKWAYINLLPIYVPPSELGASSYADYIDKFVATCQPTTLSYDHYALMEDGSLRGSYWQNLDQMRAAAKKHHLPFWNIILANAHFNYRVPTAADLQFQVFSSLAYGARGISYFTYFSPALGNYRMAAIDQFGNSTPTWNHLQFVNLQIQKLAPTLLQLTSDEVYHFGSLPEGCRPPSEKSLVSKGNEHFAFGDFTHRDGRRFVMILNKDLARSYHCRPRYRDRPKEVELISSYTGQPTPFDGEQTWLAPGQGILLRLEY